MPNRNVKLWTHVPDVFKLLVENNHEYCTFCVCLFFFTEKWMVNLSMTPGPAERRGPRREAVADDLNPMEMWTSVTVCLSATSHMMWNGRHSKTWWKKKVGSPVMDRILIFSFLHCYSRGCRFSGHFDWLLQIWRDRGFQGFCKGVVGISWTDINVFK